MTRDDYNACYYNPNEDLSWSEIAESREMGIIVVVLSCLQWGLVSTFLLLTEPAKLLTGKMLSEVHPCPDWIRETRKEIS